MPLGVNARLRRKEFVCYSRKSVGLPNPKIFGFCAGKIEEKRFFGCGYRACAEICEGNQFHLFFLVRTSGDPCNVKPIFTGNTPPDGRSIVAIMGSEFTIRVSANASTPSEV